MYPVAGDISDNDAVVTNDPAISSSSSSLTSSSDAELYDEADSNLFLFQMFYLEKLILSLIVYNRRSFVDGNSLVYDIVSPMLYLDTFISNTITDGVTILEELIPPPNGLNDLAIVITGALKNQAKVAMKILEQYAEDNLLPVNIGKTKAMLVHSVVAPLYPKIEYKGNKIDFVKRFKYLGVEIST
ncbi:unnamed protein product [Adineta steineri]|uniref:Uncharacterized protein n=1 Tax=Adineta steineri TaxID=433720 RepID=A0A814F7K0_9BILA|nr:unnamed protein product [Adineta steineri]CAF1195991.1 unnamed protein product [Adineta steineri]